MGRIPDFRDFDGNYFGLVATTAESIDAPGKLILETAHEAIIDAGHYDPDYSDFIITLCFIQIMS